MGQNAQSLEAKKKKERKQGKKKNANSCARVVFSSPFPSPNSQSAQLEVVARDQSRPALNPHELRLPPAVVLVR